MTEADLVELASGGHTSGVNLFLSKPLTPEKLDTLLSAWRTLRLVGSSKTTE